jgi:hypothetical protein
MAPNHSRILFLLGTILFFADFITGSPAWYGKRPLKNSEECCKCSGKSRSRYMREGYRFSHHGRDENVNVARNEPQLGAEFYGFARERQGELVEMEYEDSEELFDIGVDRDERERYGQLKRGRCSGDWQPCETCSMSEYVESGYMNVTDDVRIVETYQPPPTVDVVE